MNHIIQELYNFVPARLRSIPTSLRGYYLRWWRYGAETERLVTEATERDGWTVAQWDAWRANRLAHVLRRAATDVPYYRAHWETHPGQGDNDDWKQLENWPILEKEQVRQDSRAFVVDDCRHGRLFQVYTSGTTGTPLRLWQSRRVLREWYALFEARWRRWYGISSDDRWAILGGQMITPHKQTRPPFWVWNAAFKQLYMSTYHLAPALIPYYLDALRKYRVKYLLGYTSALHVLATEAIRLGQDDLNMEVVIANAEPVFEYQRSAISEAFHCPVRETYGTSEKVAAAGECEAGRMHLWPDVGIVEVMEDGKPVPAGTPGELVVTGLLNEDMPLIRYRVGDRGVLAPEGTACPCGRTLPILESIEGRTDDVLHTPDGRRIGRLDPVFKVDLPIREAQIIQETLERLRVRYVPAPGFSAEHGQEIIEHLKARMGDVEVVLEAMPRIPRTANGKFRAVICEIPSPPRESNHSLSAESGASSKESYD